jgi:exonuclease SbcD
MTSSDTFRLLHLADLHLGAGCAFLKEKADERARDFERAFERAIQFAREPENGIKLVIIAGDLFDSHRPEARLVQLVKRGFATLSAAGVQVVVVPGTHDTVSYRNSVYRTEDFGDVLVALDTSEEPFALEVDGQPLFIYTAVRGPTCTTVPIDKLTRTADDGIHIGVLHAAIQPESGIEFSDSELIVTLPELARTRLDYVALGHYHDFNQYSTNGVTAVYPGTLEGRSFDETGERYLVTTTFTPHGPVVEKIPFNARTMRQETIDLDTTTCSDQTELCDRIGQMADSDTILRLTITGNAEFSLDTAAAHAMLSDRFFYLELIDETRVYSARWVEQFKSEPTVRGVFVRKMLERIGRAGSEQERKKLDMALKFGLMELAGNDAD